MFENGIIILDWLGVIVFAMTGALVASRNQMDAVGFVLLGTVTGVGGGTIRDLLLDIHPIVWVEQPGYILLCVAVSLIAFFTAHLVQSRHSWILWLDAIGLALFAAMGAERAISAGAYPVVAIVMGIITACFGGIVRDILGQERSIIFSYEIYVTAALAAATAYVCAHGLGAPRELALSAGIILGFTLRSGALVFGWSLPRYRPRGPRQP
jgi:uncharacterized membrane protein YeiH